MSLRSSGVVQHYKQDSKSAQAKITLTDAAIAHVIAALKARGGGLGMRLAIKTSGCSGYSYVVDFIDKIETNDTTFPISENIVLAVDVKSLPYLLGTTIDFKRQGLNATFTYQNPNQTGVCGCGESFAIDKPKPE